MKELTKKVIEQNGLADLQDSPQGNNFPDRALTDSWTFKRDSKVRKHVIDKAAGKCEYCGKIGFKSKNGQHYLEAHHIISLSTQGKDTVGNVLALCSEHHREAHYGENAEKLEGKFLKKIKMRK
jgi:5-methylcytosine-specific restriction protein A